MKILIAVQHFPPNHTGGSEWEAFYSAAHLIKRGHDVRVVCIDRIDAGPANGLAWTDEVYEGVPVRRLTFNIFQSPEPDRWEYDNPWIGAHLEQLFAEDPPDVFHLISGYLMSGRTILTAQELGIPTVVSLMDFWFLCRRVSMFRSDGGLSTLPIDPQTCVRCLSEDKRRHRLLRRLAPGLLDAYWRRQQDRRQVVEDRLAFLRAALSQADVILSRSKFLGAFYDQAGFGDGRIRFVRQGQDISHIPPGGLGKTPADTLRLGYLGQIAPLKGVHVLAEAVAGLPDLPLRLQIYGNADANPAYTRRLHKLIGSAPNIEFAGVYRGQEGLNQVYRELDAVVVPSIWYENSPNVIVEAFARQTPVIASNLGGMAELVQHEKNGLLFATGDAADLRRQLARLAQTPELLPRLRAGIEPVKTIAAEIDELEDLYRAAVLESKAAALE